MIFIDTGAWIGLEDVNDKNHAEAVKLIHISEEIEEESWLVFEEFNKDKKWSFTDCTSKVVMGSLCIQEAFTFDHHFEQMGFVLKP